MRVAPLKANGDLDRADEAGQKFVYLPHAILEDAKRMRRCLDCPAGLICSGLDQRNEFLNATTTPTEHFRSSRAQVAPNPREEALLHCLIAGRVVTRPDADP